MTSNTLSFTALQTGKARHIEFPLHPQTVSKAQVGMLLTDLLDTLTRQIDNQARISDGDMLQSLCMVLAIRMHMVEAPPETVRNLVATLLEQADVAVANSTVQPAGQA